MNATTGTTPTVWWPWGLLVVILLGTGASNADQLRPNHQEYVVLAVAAAVMAGLPMVLGAGHRISLATSGFFTGCYFAAGFADGPVYLALPGVTLVVAAGTVARRWVPWAASCGALAMAGLVWRGVYHEGTLVPGIWQAMGLAALTAAAGAGGTVIRSRYEARQERARRTVSEERLRMAQDLHDGVGHGLAVIAMQAGVALHVLDQDPAKARASLEAIRTTSKESLEALRAELALIAGSVAAPGEVPRRPAPGVADLPALLDRVRAAGLRVDLAGDPGAVPERVGQVVYAVVQESLTNVLRHAGASSATVSFARTADGSLAVTVTDDGRGGAAPATEPASGLGIAGMRSRVEGLGGRFSAAPSSSGFAVRAELPLGERGTP